MKLKMAKYNNKYLKQCVNIMNDTWDFSKLFKGKTNIDFVNTTFFKFSMIDSNYKQVIIDDKENVHGYILGKINNLSQSNWKLFFKYISNLLTILWHFIAGHFGERKTAKEIFMEFFKIEAKLTSKKNSDDAYVALFLVKSSLRGAGYGTKLMNNFKDIALKKGCKRIYLWTDKGCNYGYYDHTGFKRVIELSSPIFKEYGDEPNGFAYVKPIT